MAARQSTEVYQMRYFSTISETELHNSGDHPNAQQLTTHNMYNSTARRDFKNESQKALPSYIPQ